MGKARHVERERSVAREYARLASEYDERWAAYIEASVGLTLERIPSADRFARILDVGCGTGALLAPLAARFPSAALVGVDPSEPMLEVARCSRPALAAALIAARAEALPFRDACFDLVVSTSAMHYFADHDAAAREISRVAVPGAMVVITDWCRDYATVRAFELVMRALGRANFGVLGSGDCERLLARAGFDGVVVERRRISALWGLMVARGRRAPS